MTAKIKLMTLFSAIKERLKLFDPNCGNPKSQSFKKKFDAFLTQKKAQASGKDDFLELESNKGPIFNQQIAEAYKQMLFENADLGERGSE